MSISAAIFELSGKSGRGENLSPPPPQRGAGLSYVPIVLPATVATGAIHPHP